MKVDCVNPPSSKGGLKRSAEREEDRDGSSERREKEEELRRKLGLPRSPPKEKVKK